MSVGEVLNHDRTGDFLFYRDSYENAGRQQSIEAEGLFDIGDFRNVLNDAATSALTVNCQGTERTVPLLTPAENYDSWLNLSYYRQHAGGTVPLTYFSHLSPLYQRYPSEYLETLRPNLQSIADQKGVLLLDHTDHEAPRINKELASIARELGLTFTDVVGQDGVDAKHFHYASLAQPIAKDDGAAGPKSMYEAFDQGRANGALTDGSISVSSSLSPEDSQQIWDFYEPVFNQLSIDDPVYAGLNRDEFDTLTQSPDCIKFVYRAGAAIVNLSLIADIKTCSWMNQFYYKQHYPVEYERGQIYCSPGVIANPNIPHQVSSLQTLGMVGKVIKLAGIEPVLTFACDNISNVQLPRLSELALKRAGIKTDFSKPIGHQLFRMLKVSR